jgi:hypothetical protein
MPALKNEKARVVILRSHTSAFTVIDNYSKGCNINLMNGTISRIYRATLLVPCLNHPSFP